MSTVKQGDKMSAEVLRLRPIFRLSASALQGPRRFCMMPAFLLVPLLLVLMRMLRVTEMMRMIMPRVMVTMAKKTAFL